MYVCAILNGSGLSSRQMEEKKIRKGISCATLGADDNVVCGLNGTVPVAYTIGGGGRLQMDS